jgi:hypothetical protein
MQKKNHSYYIAKSRNHYLYYLTLEANQRGLVDWGISSKSFDFESQNSDLLLEKWFLALISIWYTLSFLFFFIFICCHHFIEYQGGGEFGAGACIEYTLVKVSSGGLHCFRFY